MSKTRQQKRNSKRQQTKKIKTNRNSMKGSISREEFIRYLVQFESKLSIITNFVQENFEEEFTAYIKKIQKQADDTIETAEQDIVSDTTQSAFNADNTKTKEVKNDE